MTILLSISPDSIIVLSPMEVYGPIYTFGPILQFLPIIIGPLNLLLG
jgi:hypothetical protein